MNASLSRRTINIVFSFFTGSALFFSVLLVFIPLRSIDDLFLGAFFVGCGGGSAGYILLFALVSGGAAGIFTETVGTRNRILLFFRDSIKRKLLLALLSLFSMCGYLFVNIAIRFKYITIGKQITETVAKAVGRGAYDVAVDIPRPVKYLIVAEGYSLSEDELLRTGIIGKNLARDIAAECANTEGAYLYLTGARRCFAMVSFPSGVYASKQFLLAPSSGKVIFRIRREIKKDRFGKRYDRFIIYKIDG